MRYLECERSMADRGAPTVRHEFLSTPGSVGNARHALDGLAAELGARRPRPSLSRQLALTASARARQHQTPPVGVVQLVVAAMASRAVDLEEMAARAPVMSTVA